MVALGSNIVDRIRVTLTNEESVIDLLAAFVPPDVPHQQLIEVTDFVMKIYARMRGKDFAMKLLKKTTRLNFLSVKSKLYCLTPSIESKLKLR